jgi:flagellar biosynthesis GTPase FlhF
MSVKNIMSQLEELIKNTVTSCASLYGFSVEEALAKIDSNGNLIRAVKDKAQKAEEKAEKQRALKEQKEAKEVEKALIKEQKEALKEQKEALKEQNALIKAEKEALKEQKEAEKIQKEALKEHKLVKKITKEENIIAVEYISSDAELSDDTDDEEWEICEICYRHLYTFMEKIEDPDRCDGVYFCTVDCLAISKLKNIYCESCGGKFREDKMIEDKCQTCHNHYQV